jgi:flagellar hook-associated protein 3 FlgL
MAEGFAGSDVFMAIRNGNGRFATDYDPANTGTGRILAGAVVDPSAYQAQDFRVVFTAPDTYDVINDTTGTTVLAAQAYNDGGAIAFNGITVQIEGQPEAGDEFSITPARNQSVFSTVDSIADRLESTPAGAAAEANLRSDLDRLLGELDIAREHLVERRATYGARLNTLDAQRALNTDLSLQLKTVRSELEDIDIIEAVSNLARNTNALEAAQSAFVRVQGLSLFNFF